MARTITLPYGESEVSFEIDETRLIGILKPHEVSAAPDAEHTTKSALHKPVDGCSLQSVIKNGQTVAIVTDDYTRPTPAGPICRALLDELNELGIDDSHVRIVVGCGLHRTMDDNEVRAKFGGDLLRRVEISCHDAWDDNQNEHVGQTSRGTPIWIDRRVLKADVRITVGLIIAHFTAGYGAGPKTILPGVSGYRTIFHNHAVHQTKLSARIGVTEGNPGWEDAVEALKFLGPTLAVNVVLNTKNELVSAFHGKPVAAQKAGIELYESMYASKVKEKADIVIASANPEYAYLDQCLKTIVPASIFTRDGGMRIVASQCKEHLGPPYLRELYYDSLAHEWPSAETYEELVRTGKLKDIADASGILKFLQSNNSDMILVSDPTFDEDLTNLQITHKPTVQDALNLATEKLGQNSRVLIIPYGPIILPIT
jgi:nickel-dependent lactate racemase